MNTKISLFLATAILLLSVTLAAAVSTNQNAFADPWSWGPVSPGNNQFICSHWHDYYGNTPQCN